MRAFASLLLFLFAAACTRPANEQTNDPGATPRALEEKAPPPRVIVIGGGLAGLSAAYELQKQNIPAHLLEASDVLGGRVQTAYYGEGLDAEFGMQEMWQGNPLLDTAKELGVELDGKPEPPYSSMIIDGKLIPYVQDTPKEYFASFMTEAEQKALADWMQMIRGVREEAEKDALKSARARELQAISFAVWLQSLKLPKKVSDWIRLTLECELATTADQFSALAGLLEFGIFIGGDIPNYHVKGGNTKLIQAMGAAFKGPKTMSALVTGITRKNEPDGKIKVTVTYVKDNVVQTLEAERVVLAVPFFRVHQIVIEPPLAEERWRGIQSLGLGQYTVVHFLISKEARSLWTLAGETVLPVLTDGPLGVVYGVQHESSPSQPLDVFALLIYGMRARMWHMVPRDLKIDEALGELDRLWPGFKKHVRATHVYTYHPASLAVFPPGRSPVDELAEAVRRPDQGVYLAGDWTMGSHSDHAAKSGIEAARAIAKELVR
jgi:monoamine oxidase